MFQFITNLSVRIKLSLVLGLLGLLLLGTLLSFVRLSQAFNSDARSIKTIGEFRTITTDIKLLSRQIATAEQANQNIGLAVQNTANSIDELAHIISRFFTASESVNRVQFTRFITTLNTGQAQYAGMPGIRSAAYVPRIPGNERAAFEHSVSIWDRPDFQIYELDGAKQSIAASARPEYFPIHFIVPFEANRSQLGFDVSTDPRQLAALSQAWELGQSVMTAPIPLETGGDTIIQIFTPVYRTYTNLQSEKAKPEQLQGFVVIMLDSTSIVQAGLSQLSSNHTISLITDVTNSGTPAVVYSSTNVPRSQQTDTFVIPVLERLWAVSVPQATNIASVRQQLQTAAAVLHQNVETMIAAAENREIVSVGGENMPLLDAYLSVAFPENDLNTQVKSFLNVENPTTSGGPLSAIEDKANELDKNLQALLLLFEGETTQKVERIRQMSLIIGGIGILTLISGAIIEYGVLRDLGYVKRNALRLAGGDLNARNRVRSKDEIGQIGSVLNTMAAGLQESFKTVSESEARYRILAENVADIIAVSDAGGKFTYVSPACRVMLGYAPEEMIGTRLMDYIHPDDAAAIDPDAEMLIFEHRLCRKDGDYIWAETARRLLSHNDSPQYISVMRDITERQAARLEQERLQQQIIEAQKQAIRDLSSPVIPLTDQIIIMPLVGNIDTARARDITRALLSGISEHQAQVAILDVTGVPLVDSGVADHLNHTIQAARLKGARTIISGISPAIAETIVDLGIDWSGIQAVRDLQSGLQLAMEITRQRKNSRKFSANGFNNNNGREVEE